MNHAVDDLDLLIDLHRGGTRQGPGGDDETRRAIDLSGLRDATDLQLADIGCGTGASTFVLAQELDAHIVAVDFLPDFLQLLDTAAAQRGLGDRIATASAKIATLEQHGYSPIGYFALPQHCWLDNYYRPMQQRFADFLARHDHSDAACAIAEAEHHEVDLYERFSPYVGYGYYITRRTHD